MKSDRAEIVKRLVAAGARLDRAEMYADLFLEYQAARSNIDKNGLIVSHPRTGNPIENPFLAIRDRAWKKIQKMQDVEAGFLWGSDG